MFSLGSGVSTREFSFRGILSPIGGEERGEGAGSWRAPFRFFACIGTMDQIGTPLPALSPQGGERVAEGRERGRSMESAGVTAARTHRVNGPFHIIVHCFERRPTAASNPGNQLREKYTRHC